MISRVEQQDLKTVLQELRKFCKDGMRQSQNFAQLYATNPEACAEHNGQQDAYTYVLCWANRYLRTHKKVVQKKVAKTPDLSTGTIFLVQSCINSCIVDKATSKKHYCSQFVLHGLHGTIKEAKECVETYIKDKAKIRENKINSFLVTKFKNGQLCGGWDRDVDSKYWVRM